MLGTGTIAIRSCACAVSILAGSHGVAADDETMPLQRGLVDQVHVQMKLIDAIVVDDQGRTVPALSRDDFELFIDHVPVAIDSFDVQCASEPIADVRAVRDVRKRAATRVPDVPRKIVLVLDYPHLQTWERRFVLEDLARMIRNGKTSREEVMIVALVGSVRMEQRFTADRDVLLDALRRMDHDTSLWLPNYEWTTMTDFSGSLAALLDSLSDEIGPKEVVLYSKIIGSRDSFQDELREVAASAQEAQATLYPVYVIGVGTAVPGGSPWLAQLASDTGGQLYEKTLDLTIGYARAQRDSGCRYTFGFYTREPVDTRVESVEIVPRRPGLEVISPGASVTRSLQAKRRSWLRAAFYFPEALESPNVLGRIFLNRPKTRRVWEATLAVTFPAPQVQSGSEPAAIEFGGVLARGTTPVHTFNRRVMIHPKTSATQPDRRITFLESVDLQPGTYTLSLVIADPVEDRPRAAKLKLTLPRIPRQPVFLIAPTLERRADADIVLRGDATGPSHDRIGSSETLQPLVIPELDETQTLVVRTVACGRGRRLLRPATTIERRLRNKEGTLVRVFDPVAFREIGTTEIGCQEVVDTLPGGGLESTEYAFEALLDWETQREESLVKARFVVNPHVKDEASVRHEVE
jgi:VWFA-related protein